MNPKDFFDQASLHHVPPRRRSYPIVVSQLERTLGNRLAETSRKLCPVPHSFPWMTFGCLRIAGTPHALVYLHDRPWEEFIEVANLSILAFNERPGDIGSVCLGRYFDYRQITNSRDVEHYFWSTATLFTIYPDSSRWENEESIRAYVRQRLAESIRTPSGILSLSELLVDSI